MARHRIAPTRPSAAWRRQYRREVVLHHSFVREVAIATAGAVGAAPFEPMVRALISAVLQMGAHSMALAMGPILPGGN